MRVSVMNGIPFRNTGINQQYFVARLVIAIFLLDCLLPDHHTKTLQLIALLGDERTPIVT